MSVSTAGAVKVRSDPGPCRDSARIPTVPSHRAGFVDRTAPCGNAVETSRPAVPVGSGSASDVCRRALSTTAATGLSWAPVVVGVKLAASAGMDPALRFPLGLLAATVATLAMDQIMVRLPEGETPPLVAAGVLTELHPDGAPRRLAVVVHYLAGLLTGPLFVWLLYAGEYVAGPGLVTTLSIATVLLVLMVGFFTRVVLPRSQASDGRRRSIARDWALSAVVYLVVLVPVVYVGSELL